MLHQAKEYFHFSKNERKGIIFLIILITLVIIAKQSLVYFQPDPFQETARVDSLIAEIDRLKQRKLKEHTAIVIDSSIQFYDFNPNSLKVEDWQKFGLSEKQAQVILNYKEKAGDFKSKRQVKKMFVISDELYSQLQPHILLPDSLVKTKQAKKEFTKKWQKKYVKKKRVYPKVLINSADTAELKKLYGIGEYLAIKIVERREELGGFYSKNQLNEIWGLKEETLLKLDTQLVFNPIELQKMSINTSTKDQLKAHPYIYWKQANAIVNYRRQHGKYQKLEDLKKVILVTDSIYDKVYPYLEL